MSTVRDIIKGSLRLLGATAAGETPTAQEMSDALEVLNQMIDSWSLERLIIYSKVNEVFSLVPSQGAYTMGSGGNFDTSRPLRIEAAYLKLLSSSPNVEIPIKIVFADEWASISLKTMTSNIPSRLYVSGSNPLETLNFWPVPTDANSVSLWSWKPLAEFTSVNDSAVLPPGYLKALRYSLAMELSAEYGIQPSQVVAISAGEGREMIKRHNIVPQIMSVDEALTSRGTRFNYRTGDFQ